MSMLGGLLKCGVPLCQLPGSLLGAARSISTGKNCDLIITLSYVLYNGLGTYFQLKWLCTVHGWLLVFVGCLALGSKSMAETHNYMSASISKTPTCSYCHVSAVSCPSTNMDHCQLNTQFTLK